MFVRTQTNGSRTYLLIVDNVRVGGKVKQRVLHRLGRLDELLANGQLDLLIQSLSRFSEKLAVLGAHAQGNSIVTHSTRVGPALIFHRLWQACSIDKVLSALLADRRFGFSVERAIFLTVRTCRRRPVRLPHRPDGVRGWRNFGAVVELPASGREILNNPMHRAPGFRCYYATSTIHAC